MNNIGLKTTQYITEIEKSLFDKIRDQKKINPYRIFINQISADTTPRAVDDLVHECFGSYEKAFKYNDDTSNLLGVACIVGNLALVKHLIAQDENSQTPLKIVNLPDAHKITPLCHLINATENASTKKIVEYLIQKGAAVNHTSELIRAKNIIQVTPLWMALVKGKDAIAALLLRHQAIATPELSEDLESLKNVLSSREKNILHFGLALKRNESMLRILPEDVLKIIFSFVKS